MMSSNIVTLLEKVITCISEKEYKMIIYCIKNMNFVKICGQFRFAVLDYKR